MHNILIDKNLWGKFGTAILRTNKYYIYSLYEPSICLLRCVAKLIVVYHLQGYTNDDHMMAYVYVICIFGSKIQIQIYNLTKLKKSHTKT